MSYLILDINECENGPVCHVNATCNNTDGSFMCQCHDGYEGDGFTCAGMYNYVINLLTHMYDVNFSE